MARNVKGITIEIGAETTKLTNALKDIDGGLKKTQSKLKDVNKLLKLDPKNTELLRQKQDALKTAIDQTSDRLKELKKAAQEATPETVGQEQYDNLQREIVDTEQKLDKELSDSVSDKHRLEFKIPFVGDTEQEEPERDHIAVEIRANPDCSG